MTIVWVFVPIMCLIITAETWMTIQARELANQAVEDAADANVKADFWEQEQKRWAEQYSVCKSMLTKEQRNSLDGVQ